VTPERLQEAARASEVWREMRDPDYARLRRGLSILLVGLRQGFGQERLHQYVRALEALILPEQGKTKKQFVHRCQTFGGSHQDIATILSEAFDMRSDVEHLHAWDRALTGRPVPDRKSLAMKRTRQMEGVACSAYCRILSEADVRRHFGSDESIADFWALSEERRRSIWRTPFDLSAVP
jgi:hypothetical protein